MSEWLDLPARGAHVHLVGVRGAGMRGLAVLLAGEGFRVTGCDRAGGAALDDLREHGVRVWEGHDPSHVAGADLIVHTAAVPGDAPELAAARDAGVPVLKRARVLAGLLASRRLVGVAGTHGKTTITAMAGLACEAAGLDPAVAVGGLVPAWRGCARTGAGEVAVAEADEYDGSFLEMEPSLAVVSSVEAEHLESYGSVEALREAFAEFAGRAVRRDGVLFCADEPGARAVGEGIPNGRSYGFAPGADYRVGVLEAAGAGQRCRLDAPVGPLEFDLSVPGEHNAQNAAAALAAALEVGAAPDAAAEGLKGFTGVERRLQVLVEREGVAVVDDYAHHPTEVRASLAALRLQYPGRRLVLVFQPHLFSRTRAFAPEFARALEGADRALVLPIYPAREEPIPGVTSARIVEGAEGDVAEASKGEALALVREAAAGRRPAEPAGDGDGGEVFVFMGAGDVTELAREAAAEVAGHPVAM